MKRTSLLLLSAMSFAAIVGILSSSSVQGGSPQEPAQEKKETPQSGTLSEPERQAIIKINSAPDASSKLQAADELLKKFPEVSRRNDVAHYVAGEISQVQVPDDKIALAQNYMTVFDRQAEKDIITPVLIDAFVARDRIGEAFNSGSGYVERNPEDVAVLTQLALVGVEQVKRGNNQFVRQSTDYGERATNLIEADRKPEAMDDLTWSEYRLRWLPQLYQSLGLVSMVSGNIEDARSKISKAASMNSSDPVNYLLLGNLSDEEYQQTAQKVKALAPGKEQEDMLAVALKKMDEVIDYFARAVALMHGNTQFDALRTQVMEPLSTYYAFRNDGKTDGLQALIDKYKQPK